MYESGSVCICLSTRETLLSGCACYAGVISIALQCKERSEKNLILPTAFSYTSDFPLFLSISNTEKEDVSPSFAALLHLEQLTVCTNDTSVGPFGFFCRGLVAKLIAHLQILSFGK